MAKLITVSGKQINLRRGSNYLIGRDSACNVVVKDCACSRKHARLTVNANEDIHVEDLKSRNGTFVNGRKIEERTLVVDGGQIRLGTTILVVGHEGYKQPSLETMEMYTEDTLLLESKAIPPSSSSLLKDLETSGIGGHLSSVSLLDVLQLLTQMGRSGTLRLDLNDGQARIEIREGRILAAVFGSRTGIDALQVLTPRNEGRFQFVECKDDCQQNIDLPTHSLFLEICRNLDESAAVDLDGEVDGGFDVDDEPTTVHGNLEEFEDELDEDTGEHSENEIEPTEVEPSEVEPAAAETDDRTADPETPENAARPSRVKSTS